MNPTRVPDNEPDPGDISTDSGEGGQNQQPERHDLPDEEAEKLGNFAWFERRPVAGLPSCAEATTT